MTAMIDVEKYRNEFPVTKHFKFFSHASVAPISRRAADRMRAGISDVLENGSVNSAAWNATYLKTRKLAAQLINCDYSEIAFLKNTSEGLCFVANGLDWGKGDNVVTVNVEFPANIYPWMNLQKEGVETRLVEEVDARIPIDAIASAIDDRTRVLSISFVQYISGFRSDMDALGDLCEQRGILFVVDAIQGLGMLPMDVKRSKIHVVCADAHKWLLGPEGIAIFYIAADAMDMIDVSTVGWASVINAGDYSHYDFRLRKDARRYECGTMNTAGIYGLEGALDLLLEVGIENIEQRILSLTDYLCDGLTSKGCSIFSPRGNAEKSGIVSFTLKDGNEPHFFKQLLDRKIIPSLRDGKIRVSPHFYNTEEEIDELIQALPG